MSHPLSAELRELAMKRGWPHSGLLTQSADLIEQLTAPISGDIDKVSGTLMSARRYVVSYSENENNHPQARDGARNLVVQIDGALDLLRSAEFAKSEAVRAAYEDAAKIAEGFILDPEFPSSIRAARIASAIRARANGGKEG